MKKLTIIYTLLLFSFVSWGQEKDTQSGRANFKLKKKFIPKLNNIQEPYNEQSKYYHSYDFYRDIYNSTNEVELPIEIFIWQKDDGTGNYSDIPFNNEVLEKTIEVLDLFYTDNPSPSFKPLPNVIDYESTKIRYKLVGIHFIKNEKCWKTGSSTSNKEGVFLNHIADSIYPASSNHFKIHITGAQSPHLGFSTGPTTDFKHEHFVVTFNKEGLTRFAGTEPDDRAWPFAMHLAHEIGHSLDLYHTYGSSGCNENNADYLDDVFGSSRNNSKVCPQDGGWDCDYTLPDNTCTNNIMGGNKGGRYFSPKQVQRMHRALSQKSIRNYTIAYQFDNSQYIDISDSVILDFSMKFYTNIRVKNGATLVIKGNLEFVPQAKIVVEPFGKLIVDGGTLTNEKYYNSTWKGVEILKKKERRRRYQGTLEIINGGKIENVEH